MRCRHHERRSLLKLRKKIVYLDQSFFSRAFRANDMEFVKAAQRLVQLSLRQAIVVPYSTVHELETHQWRGADGKTNAELMHFIKRTTGNHQFKPDYQVQKDQLIKAFIRFTEGKPPVRLEEEDALPHDIHGWTNYVWIDVRGFLGDPEKVRRSKEISAQQLVDLFAEWRISTDGFDEDVESELRGGSRALIQLYKQYVDLIAAGDYMKAMLDTSVNSTIVQVMLLHCFDESTPMARRAETVHAFFESDHYKAAPYQGLSARMFAVLKDMVRRGAYPDKDVAVRRLRGFFHDVDHIATYAPYCDAFFMDNAMAEMMRDPRIGLEKRYETKVFSLSSLKKFLVWMEEVDAGLSDEHVGDLEYAYPDSVADPMEVMRAIAAEMRDNNTSGLNH